jgi:chromosome condensin MukBEF ATPase and DNA-binding subunit MukB
MTDDKVKTDIAVLQSEMRDVKEDLHDIKRDVREMLIFMQQARGSWKTVMGIAGASAAVGALVAKIIPLIPLR